MANYIFSKGKWRGHSQNDTIPTPVGKYLARRVDTDTGIEWFSDGYDWVRSGTPVGASDYTGPISGKKTGRFDGASTASGSGIFSGTFSTAGTAGGVTLDTTNGPYTLLTSGAVSGNTANFRWANPYTTRAWNPYLAVKFMIGTALNNRVHIGFKQVAFTAPADGTNDPLASTSGLMLVQTSSASANNFFIYANNGGGSSSPTDTGVQVAANTLYTIKFRALSDSKFQWSLNNSNWADVTTQIPASTTGLGNYNGIQTGETAAHTLKIYAIETKSDK